jgi:hypothetical protein
MNRDSSISLVGNE